MTDTQPAPPSAPPAAVAAPDVDPVAARFASRSITVHLLRGVLGLALAVAAFAYAGDHPWALLGLVGTVVAWRGCPTCWALGLGATLAGRRARCAAGRCG